MKSGRKAVWVALCLLVVSVVLLAVFLFVGDRGKAGVLHAAWAPSVDGQTMAALLADETDTAAGPEEEHTDTASEDDAKANASSAERTPSTQPSTANDAGSQSGTPGNQTPDTPSSAGGSSSSSGGHRDPVSVDSDAYYDRNGNLINPLDNNGSPGSVEILFPGESVWLRESTSGSPNDARFFYTKEEADAVAQKELMEHLLETGGTGGYIITHLYSTAHAAVMYQIIWK